MTDDPAISLPVKELYKIYIDNLKELGIEEQCQTARFAERLVSTIPNLVTSTVKVASYDMVRDQRSISVSTEPIFDISLSSISHTFSCILYLGEFIFFTFHAKSVLWGSFTDFPIVNTLSEQRFYYRNGEKTDVKKKRHSKLAVVIEKNSS